MKDYKKYINEIKEIINTNDPWDLIYGGAPIDEYEDYINKIFSLIISKNYSFSQLQKVFKEVEENKLIEIDKGIQKVIMIYNDEQIK